MTPSASLSKALLAGLLFACSASVPTVFPTLVEGQILLDSSIVILDVRSAKEFSDSSGHLASAVHLPIRDIEADPSILDRFRGSQVVVYCRSGGRSTRATRILRQRGIEAYHLDGGMLRWTSEGRAVIVEEQNEEDDRQEDP